MSDLHLSEDPPVARSAETNWLAVQAKYLTQLSEMLPEWDTPVICAGDVFHTHNPSPAVINMALEFLPEMYAVPGQHDLPLHNYKDIEKSAFWTMVSVRKIKLIPPYDPEQKNAILLSPERIRLFGFPWGHRVCPPGADGKIPNWKNVAVVHSYIWAGENKFVGAPDDKKVSSYAKKLKGYHIAVFGDNHKGFLSRTKYDTQIANNGGFLCRNADEKDYVPTVGLIHKSGAMTRRRLDTTWDQWAEPSKGSQPDSGESPGSHQYLEFLESLNSLSSTAVDFLEACKKWLMMHNVGKEVKTLILRCLEESK